MNSACTFADIVVKALKAFEMENGGVHFELFFTGHSLGAWLAQVTTFCNLFLKRGETSFKRLGRFEQEPYHAQAIVYDSPGCLPMLQKLKEKFDYEDREPILLQNLSIASYLSAPNQVNTCNEHFGKVFRLFIDTTKMTFMDRNVGYTLMMHSITNIVKTLNLEQQTEVHEVMEWPIRKGITNGEELETFLKYADYRNRYHIANILKQVANQTKICYKTKRRDDTLCRISIFSKREQHFLQQIRWIRKLPEFVELKEIFGKLMNLDVASNLPQFDIVGQNVYFTDTEQLKRFIPEVKLLLKLFPEIVDNAKVLMADEAMRGKVFAFESKICLEQASKDQLNFIPGTIDWPTFFEKQFCLLRVKSGKARNGLTMICEAFEQSDAWKSYSDSSVLVLDVRRFAIVNDLICIKKAFDSAKENFLLIVYCEQNENLKDLLAIPFRNLLAALPENPQVKVILIGDSNSRTINAVSLKAKEVLGDGFYEVEESLSWFELTKDSQERVLNRTVKFQGRQEKLKCLMPPEADVNDEVFMQILNEECLEVNDDHLARLNFSVYTTDNDKLEIQKNLILESLELSDDIFVLSGIYDEKFEDIARNLKNIFNARDAKEQTLVEKNIVFGADLLDAKVGKLHVINFVGNDKCLEEFDEKCRNMCEETRRAVHWVKAKDGKFTWRKSFNFAAYVGRKLKTKAEIVTDTDLCRRNQRLVAVIGRGGEGKSKLLVHMGRKLSATSWVIPLKLDDLPLADCNFDKMDHKMLANFISEMVHYDPKNLLQKFLLLQNLSAQSEKPIHFLLDGFDKIPSEGGRSKALTLMKFIMNETKCFITLASRDTYMNALNALEPTVYTFEKLTRLEREKLIKEYWRSQFAFVWGHKKCSEIFAEENSKFKSYAAILLDQLDKTMEEKALVAMGIPKQLRLLAAGFKDDFDKFVHDHSIRRKIFDALHLKSLYPHYIKSKYELYVKVQGPISSIKETMGFRSLQLEHVEPMVQQDILSQMEFYSTDYIIMQMMKDKSPGQVLANFTGYLLVDPKLTHIRTYLNTHKELLPSSTPFQVTEETSKTISSKPMITCCKEGQGNVLKFLIDVLKKKPDLKNFVLSKDESGKSALNYAIENDRPDCVQHLLELLAAHGDQQKFKEVLLELNVKALRQFVSKTGNINFIDWLERVFLKMEIK